MGKSPEIDTPVFEKTKEVVKKSAGSPQEVELHRTTGDRKGDILRVIEELKSQLESSYAVRDAFQSDLSDVKNTLSDKEKKIDELNSQLASIKKQVPIIKGLQDEIIFLNEEMRNAHDKVENLEAELADKETAVKDLQSRLISAEEEKSKLLQEMMSKVENSRDLQRELANVARERDSALMKVKRLESEIEKLRESGRALDEIHQALADTKRIAKR